MSLYAYQKKRKFAKTPEPKGTVRKSADKKLSFVVQKHNATNLHYDLRLEQDGVLKSWAVPKGISMNPKEKHLAVHVEDHPLAYGKFHGRIPKGQYGAGTVSIWDKGTYRKVKGSIARGQLEFELFGRKLKGMFVLMRLPKAERKDWLIIKMRDEFAKTS